MPTISLFEQELIVARQTLQPMHPGLRSKAESLEALKERLEELKQEASQAFDERVTKEAADAGSKQLLTVRMIWNKPKAFEENLKAEIGR